jgi:ribosomal protein S10
MMLKRWLSSTGGEGELRRRVVNCIREHVDSKQGLSTNEVKSPPKSADVIIRGLSIPLIDAYATFCRAIGSSMGAIVPGATSLPTRIQKWSVLSSPHVHKTAFTQLERRVYGRTVKLYGLHPENMSKFVWYIGQYAPPDVKFECYMHEYIPIGKMVEAERGRD